MGYCSIFFVSYFDYRNWPGELRRWVMGISFICFASKIAMLPFLFGDNFKNFVLWIVEQLKSKPHESIGGPPISRSLFLKKSALLAGGTLFTSLLWGMVRTAYNILINKEIIKLKNLPDAFNGFKIIQISDLHLGSFASTEPVENMVEKINELNPDIVFFTGDLVNDRAMEAIKYIEILKKIKTKYGVFSSLGNHDYGDYVEWPSQEAKMENLQNLKNIHQKIGWNLLLNENIILEKKGQKIAIIGVENWGHKLHFPKYGKIETALKGTENIPVKLLLSHDPSHWDYEISQKYKEIDITFAGHTHGFQFGIEIPALKIKWSPSQYIYPHWAGLYNKENQYLYVNRGMGFLGYYGRVGIQPEITVVGIEKCLIFNGEFLMVNVKW
ncbi:MAG: metallophosphoesterase [Bacteroidetes bacterium]|nr:metallophosphoesterase [Bacteroidota bacterium]